MWVNDMACVELMGSIKQQEIVLGDNDVCCWRDGVDETYVHCTLEKEVVSVIVFFQPSLTDHQPQLRDQQANQIYKFPNFKEHIVVEGLLELFTVAQKQIVVKRFDHEDLLQLQRTEVMA